jgi:hypothetical protein
MLAASAIVPVVLSRANRSAIASASATPGATPEGEALSPEETFALLRDAPFASPLLSADAGEITITEATGESNDELMGAIGGLFFEGSESPIGAMIVWPDDQAASDRVNLAAYSGFEGEIARAVEFGGYTGMSILSPESNQGQVKYVHAKAAIAVGPVIVSGGASGVPEAELELRALANCIALLDHLRRVTAS